MAVVRRAGLRIPGLQDLQPCCSGKKTGKVKTEGDKVRKRHNPQYRLDLACVADNISMSCPAWLDAKPESIDWVFAELDTGQNGVVCKVRASYSTAETVTFSGTYNDTLANCLGMYSPR